MICYRFDFNTYLTKEYLLSFYTQEEYLAYYLGIPVKKGLFRNPLRDDKSPTASFYRNKKGDIIFKDFSGFFSGNFIDVVMFKYDCSYKQALRVIANDFNIQPGISLPVARQVNASNLKTGSAKIQIEKKDFTKEELNWWKQFGISLPTLKKFKVFSCKSIFLNDSLNTVITPPNMAFGYYGGILDGLEQWRIYFPLRKSYRFLTNWSAKKIQGLDNLPQKGPILCITKSMKDVLCLYEFGIPAIAPNSENLFITKELLQKLRNRFILIVVLYDQDKAGRYNLVKIRREHPDLEYVLIPKSYKAKDISDFYKMYGKDETKNLIVQYITFLKQKYGKTEGIA